MLIEEFWGRMLKPTNGCWLWTGATTGTDRYGVLSFRGRTVRAHRLAYELTIGPIPKGMAVCHKCDVPGCCNPSHLFLGTVADNNRDRHGKGRTRNLESGREALHAEKRARTHCSNGHELTPENTGLQRNGSGVEYRTCKACRRIYDTARRAGKKTGRWIAALDINECQRLLPLIAQVNEDWAMALVAKIEAGLIVATKHRWNAAAPALLSAVKALEAK